VRILYSAGYCLAIQQSKPKCKARAPSARRANHGILSPSPLPHNFFSVQRVAWQSSHADHRPRQPVLPAVAEGYRPALRFPCCLLSAQRSGAWSTRGAGPCGERRPWRSSGRQCRGGALRQPSLRHGTVTPRVACVAAARCVKLLEKEDERFFGDRSGSCRRGPIFYTQGPRMGECKTRLQEGLSWRKS
jgi:hypothetical protein